MKMKWGEAFATHMTHQNEALHESESNDLGEVKSLRRAWGSQAVLQRHSRTVLLRPSYDRDSLVSQQKLCILICSISQMVSKRYSRGLRQVDSDTHLDNAARRDSVFGQPRVPLIAAAFLVFVAGTFVGMCYCRCRFLL